jgi:hypothetical protein
LQTIATTTLTSTATSYIGTTTSTQATVLTNTVTSTTFTLPTGGTAIGGAIPGFPVESIIAGIGVAVACLMIMRRVRIRSRGEQ